MSAGFAPARLGAALGASLVAHMALLGAFGSLPSGRQGAVVQLSAPFLSATLRSIESKEPKEQAAHQAAVPRLPALPAPRYYAAHELDERPLILNHVEPQFPTGMSPGVGRLTLRLYIGEHGRVDSVDVTQAEPAGVFDAAAAQAFAAARFRPGMLRGEAVKSTLTLEVLFGAPLPADPSLSRSVEGERAPLANPNAADAPDRAGIIRRRGQ